MLKINNTASRPENDQTSRQLAFILAAIDQTLAYIAITLEQHLKTLDDDNLQSQLQKKLLELQGKLQPKGEYAHYVNTLVLEQLREHIEQEREAWFSYDEALELPEGFAQNMATALLKALVRQLERIIKIIDEPTIAQAIWRSFWPYTEQQLRQQADIKTKIDELLHKLKPIIMNRYKLDNFTAEKGQYHPSCFISYAWPLIPDENQDETWTQPFIYQLALDLKRAGVKVHMDKLESYAGMDVVA